MNRRVQGPPLAPQTARGLDAGTTVDTLIVFGDCTFAMSLDHPGLVIVPFVPHAYTPSTVFGLISSTTKTEGRRASQVPCHTPENFLSDAGRPAAGGDTWRSSGRGTER